MRNDRNKLIESVLNEYGADMRRFLQLRLALEEDREDLIQELFVRLARVENLAESLAAETGNTRSYLFSILNNLILDLKRRYVRRGGSHESYDDEQVVTRTYAPEVKASSQQQLDRAMKILKGIRADHRQAFVLHRFKNMSYQDISEEMGVSLSSVDRYIASALVALREGMKE